MKIYVHDCGRAYKGVGGYPTLNREMIKQFIHMGHEVLFDVQDKKQQAFLGTFEPYLEKKANFKPQDADFILSISPPYSFRPQNFPNKIHIGWTVFEDDFLPHDHKSWIPIMNEMSAMITCSDWNNEMLKNEGINVPLFKVKSTVDKSIFNDGKGDKFKMLCVHEGAGANTSRERWQETLKWTCEVLEGKHAELTIKTWNGYQSSFLAFYDQLKHKIPVSYHEGLIPYEDMSDFYKEHHLFIKNTKREGLCIPAAEAIACGLLCLSRPLPASMEVYMDGNANEFFENEKEFKYSLLECYKEWESQQFYGKNYQEVAKQIVNIYEELKKNEKKNKT